MIPRKKQSSRFFTKIELAVGLDATLVAVWLHFIFLRHAGALWRDEAGGVQVATLPGIGEMWRMLPHGGFPAGFPMIVRIWTAVGFGDDSGLRLLGFLIGLSVLAALWWNAWIMGRGIPLLSLGLLAANITLVSAGDSLRAYGCGSFFMLLSLGLVWTLMRLPDWKRFLAASLAGILSVQCLYQNAFLLLAVCGSAAWVCLRRGQWRTSLVVLAAGLPAALSLVPYIKPVRQAQDWWIISKIGLDPSIVWENLSSALATPLEWQKWVWIGMFLLVVGAGIASLLKKTTATDIAENDLTLFAATACVAGSAAFFVFLWLAQLPTQPWQYLALITFVAACVDATLADWLKRHHVLPIIFVGVMVCMPLPRTIELAKYRQTNIDVIAAQLQKSAATNDLIIVYPWYCGVTFGRYYHGQTPWITLPDLADHRFHRYDLLKEKLRATEPIKPVLDRAAATLASGHHLWIVGELPPPQPGETRAPDLPPAPNNTYGWFDAPYSYVWGLQLRQSLATNADQVEPVPVASPTRVNPFENLPLTVVAGWRSKPSSTVPN